MKKIIFFFCFIFSNSVFSQYDLSAGMGLNFFSSPDLRDYLNSNFASTDEMSSFSTSADFFIEFDYNLNAENRKSYYQIGIDYTFNIYSFNSNFAGGQYDLTLNQHKPSLLVYYVLAGEGYKFKFGGGVGLRLAKAEEKLYGSNKDYSTTGVGFLIKAQGDTRLGGNFYALIAGEIQYDIPGEINTLTGAKFNVNSFGVALKLGTVYYF